MQPGRNTRFVGDLRRIFAGEVFPPGDRSLLDGFVTDRDEAAFEALVGRHGPMVRGICRRILRNPHDADDAFQATFLVLLLKSRRIADADRLSPWLFGVATRVALKSRARGARRLVRLGVAVEPAAPAPDHDLLDVMPLIDIEIARLPAKLRAAVIVCLVEGATLDEAAQRLGCPVGTVKSRLARGRETLRGRLTRRGVAPSIALAALDLIAPTPVAATLVRLTLRAAAAPTLAPSLIALTQGVAPAMIAPPTAVAALLLGGIVLAGGGLTTAWLKSAAQAQAQAPRLVGQPRPISGSTAIAAQVPFQSSAPVPADAKTPPPVVAIADRLARIKAEYRAEEAALRQALDQAVDGRERSDILTKMPADDATYCRRMVDLALTNPTDPAARDALIWVINKPYRADYAAYGDEFARAGALLVRHHGDDPVAVCVGLGLTNVVTDRRDSLLRGFFASARGREAKGIARLALAQYLAKKATFADGVGPNPPRGKHLFVGMVGDDGKVFDKEVDETDEDHASKVGLGLSDPQVIRAEAKRLYHEVIADYGDVPWANIYLREMVALLREPEPTQNGKPMTADEVGKLRATVEVKRTLGGVARARLDEMENLVPGKPAPAIDGMTLDGKPMKLVDFRGKVVVLVFWESGCGPCLREFPRERELAERLQGRPFALLGVDCEEDKAVGLKVVRDHNVTWPSWFDGGDHPIMARYHVAGFPTTVVIDAQGIIRHEQLSGPSLAKAVDDLLAETEARPPTR